MENQSAARSNAFRITLMVAAVGLVAVAGFVVLSRAGWLPGFFVSETSEEHYTALERHRAQQRAAIVESPPPAETPAPATAPAEAAPATPEAPAEAPAATPLSAPASVVVADFRGPRRDGNFNDVAIRTDWPSSGLTPLWKQPIGTGYASFVVADGVAFTIEQRRRQEVVAAYEVATGRELWVYGWDAEFRESMGGDGPRATPTWHEGRVYALGATGELHCIDARTGKRVWARNILKDAGASNLDWGMAASPLIVDDKVITHPGGSNGNSVIAYNKNTGAIIWKAQDDKAGYASPMLVELAGRRQLLVVSGRRLMGLTVERGELLWDFGWEAQYGVNAAQPIIIGKNRVFISSGYGKGAAVIEILPSGQRFTARAVWQNTSMKNKFNSSVLHEGYIYGLDEGILTCVNAETGERKWKAGRYGYGQLLLASNHLVIISDSGELVLVKATPEAHTEVARFSAIQGKTWNNPVLTGPILLVRNGNEMAAFKLGE